MGMHVDQAGRQHTACTVKCLRAIRRRAIAQRSDFAAFEQHPAGKTRVRFIHRPDGYILYQLLIHAKPLKEIC